MHMSVATHLSRRSFIASAALAFLASSGERVSGNSRASSLTGTWAGVMVRDGKALEVELSFVVNAQSAPGSRYYCPMDRQIQSDRPGKCPICGMELIREDGELRATFTSMTQAVMQYPLQQLKVDGGSFQALLGDSMALDGRVEGAVLKGKFTDGEAQGTFELHRTAPAPPPYRTRSVTFQNGAIKLAGTVCIPGTPSKHSGVILLHGSGPQSRWGTNRYLADQFARAGIAALAYDKRGCGDSTGEWQSSTYEDLASDAIAAVKLLASLPEVDGSRVGLHGHSEGGIVAAVAASMHPRPIAFIVAEDTVAGPVYQQDIYRTHVALMQSAFSPDQREDAERLYTLFIDAARGVLPREKLIEAAAEAQRQPWFSWLGLPDEESWIWRRYPKLANVNTLELWRHVEAPTLLVYGERDQLVPVDESIAKIEGAFLHPDHRNTSFIVPGAQHNLTIQPEERGPFFWWRTAPGVYALIIDWVRSLWVV